MLEIVVPLTEGYDESTKRFVSEVEVTLNLEHSLVSLSKWESHFEKPFLSTEKTAEETLWYVKAMNVSPGISPEVYLKLKSKHVDAIKAYIDAKMTATTFNDHGNQRPNREIITAEIIYYWMITLNIPFECQHWHLNKLLTLVRVIQLKNAPKKKINKDELRKTYRDLNAQRKAEMGTSG